MTNRFSRIKSSFFGPSKDLPVADSSSPPTTSRRSNYKPIRYELPTEDSSEPSQYFKEHGHPWTQYRAPTPLPPFGTDEYYKVIKSSNPSPTTSNESEIGSSPEDISSREDLFLPDPPDMPESPYPKRSNMQSGINNEGVVSNPSGMPGVSTQVAAISPNNTSFVPFRSTSTTQVLLTESQSHHHQGHQRFPRKIRGRTVASSGEEAVGQNQQLVRTHLNQSDPVLSTSTTRVDVENIRMTQQPVSYQGAPDSSISRSRESQHRSFSQQSSPLTRQSAFDPGSSRENTPQK